MRADDKLEQLGIEYDVIETEEAVHTCEEAADARGIRVSQVVKSLIVERDGDLFHVCIPGDRTLSEKKFGEHRLVDPEDSRELTGQESGTVHPFSTDLKHLVDERIFDTELISFTVGNRHEGVLFNSDDFLDALEKLDFELEVRDLVVTREEDVEEIEAFGVDHESARFIVNKGYRKRFLELVKEFEPGDVIDAVRKLNREDIDFTVEQASEIIERAENETHMQKLAEKLSNDGELGEEAKFELEPLVEDIIEEEERAVQDYREGRDSAINYLMGQVMQRSSGRADAGKAKALLVEKLDE
ncbi:MAG: YbaK/EbsC family protein [Candidatus Nanohaloarchaea archaeon]